MNNRHISATSLAAVTILMLSACGASKDAPAASSSSAGSSSAATGSGLTGAFAAHSPIKKIYFSNVLPSYPPLAEANKCLRDEATKQGIQAQAGGPTGPNVDNQRNIDLVSQAIANGYDAIISQPIDKAAFTPVMQQARTAGIWQATINTGSTTDIQNFTIGTDYGVQGSTVSKELSKRSGDQYVGIIGDAPTGTNNVFVVGFKNGITSQNLSNVHFVTNEFDGGKPDKTVDTVLRMLTAHPKINVVMSWQGLSTTGIITAIKEKKAIGKIVGVTNDVTAETTDGIKSGVLYGTSQQNFCKMAIGAVDSLISLGKGKTVPKAIDSGITFVTKENVNAVGK